jgi:hypothetical protein
MVTVVLSEEWNLVSNKCVAIFMVLYFILYCCEDGNEPPHFIKCVGCFDCE